jgi:hypothetical protein
MSLFHHLFLPHDSNNQRAKLLHPSSFLLLIALFILFQLGLGRVSSGLPQILGYASQIPPEEIVRLTNLERTNRGLSALTLNTQLSQAAARKAADMFTLNYWAHVSPTGTQPWYFITSAGYSYRYAGENLARDFSDPGSVVQAWLNSPSHRDNLLNSRYADIGVAVIDGRLEGRDTTLVVQMFATPLANAPQISGTSTQITVHAQDISPAPTTTMATPSPIPPAAKNLPDSGSFLASTDLPPSGKNISPFELTKYASLGLLAILVSVLLIDILVIKKKKIIRWTSKSFAHLIFLAILLIAALTVLRGQIL